MKRNFYASLVLILFSIFIFAAEGSAAYYIQYWHLSHRVYEDGRELNRLSFALFDDATGYPPEDIVASVELTYQDEHIVPLENLSFGSQMVMYGGYDEDIDHWYFFENFGFESWYGADVTSDLLPGWYHLTVIDTDGNTYEGYYDFYGLVDLPIISSSSFRTRRDEFGNFIWEWGVPYYLDPNLETGVRGIIRIYDRRNNLVAMLWTWLQPHLGRLFVPREVLEKIPSEGKRFKLQIALRTNDANNHSYSNERLILPF